jgi:DNA-binding NtrC family response regulator
LAVAAAEPAAILRAEVLGALEVRRPDLRPLVQWMNDRAAALASVVACDGETEGVLVLPRGRRAEPVTLEELRAFKVVADRLATACHARGTQARMLDRAQQATQRANVAEERVEQLVHLRDLDVNRDALATTRLARPATVGVYSAAARGVLEAIERRTAAGAPIVVLAPSGADPVPYLARAHLAGVRAQAPLVLVDATSVREHDRERWIDPLRSPLALADRGLLVLLDGAALPADIQQLVARVCSEKRAPWERAAPLDVQLALTTVVSVEELLAQGRLDGALAARLGDAVASAVLLPRLRDRPEDLRAILTDRLAREGLRVRGRPVGIDHAAYARLVDYEFPGEDVELVAIAQRLVARCDGDVVRAADIDALALEVEPGNATAGTRKDPLSA